MSWLFISIDGPSGIGKSTVSALLRSTLEGRGVPTVLTTEPSRSRLGEPARYGTHEYRGPASACLVAADRYRYLEREIRPAVRAGHVVICDRYVPSSLVLQRLDGADRSFLWAINQAADRPDLAVILTGDPARSHRRAARRGTYSRFQRGGLRLAVKENRLFLTVARGLCAAGRCFITMSGGTHLSRW